jgi:hypothetical protein
MKKGKEQVIIFSGEDKFIKKRHRSYDAKKGVSEYVGSDAVNQVSPMTDVPLGDPQNQQKKVIIPNQGETDLCKKLFYFISTRGDGKADNDSIMEAHRRFRRYCANPEESTTTSSTTSTTTLSGSIPVIPLISGNSLGIAPGGGGGGGNEAASVEQPKKNYWWLLLVGLTIYIFAKKDNK